MSDAFAEVLRVLTLERTGDDEFVGASLPQVNERVYGGQVLAQAVLAAGRTVPGGRDVHSVHGYFLRPGDIDVPITFAVERLRDGGSFSARRTHALQDGVPILSLIASFQERQSGVEHEEPSGLTVPPPEDLASNGDLFSAIDHPMARFLARTAAFDIRHVGPPLYVQPDPEPTTHQALWMRPTGALEGEARSDRLLNAVVLAYACDQVMLEPVLRAHHLAWRMPGISVASLDHAMWWHRDVDVSDWLLYVQDSPSARGGRGLGTARVYTRDGALVATIAQEGMVRAPR
ncbi:Palmitoyl-CoA hydrolase [Beutenbergia cavernae DSM 12333]|uniref:Palmitoyl-CoA hydrolase n=1 Tax=Beutenbergia cavernae (strain ATCC BAA-8 / DSM 12333 / CCUG 43141 / JCM 11478 / NBRC 16432 / NCIMB 13614 / HKI 0122) TaxID=471853 RepID=C5BXK0_BEUC1|nr:acyl-CoA thioesterase II [Beutenbergia cavernae]ACQ80883.1 Palmitoyl-CoA hydrolase [Beutenbergia cavernae DSM 12333]